MPGIRESVTYAERSGQFGRGVFNDQRRRLVGNIVADAEHRIVLSGAVSGILSPAAQSSVGLRVGLGPSVRLGLVWYIRPPSRRPEAGDQTANRAWSLVVSPAGDGRQR